MSGVVLAVIPARGGSKGVPHKNIRHVGGRPLIAYAVEAARGARRVDHLLVSTDSAEIAALAEEWDARPDQLRPAELSGDEASTVAVVRYEVERYERSTGRAVAIVVLLQPTTPLRRAADIDAAVTLLEEDVGADSVFTAYDGQAVHPRIMYRGGVVRGGVVVGAEPLLAGSMGMQRQDFEPVYVRNGAVYAARRELLDRGRLVGDHYRIVLMPRERSINVDEELDLVLADALLRHG